MSQSLGQADDEPEYDITGGPITPDPVADPPLPVQRAFVVQLHVAQDHQMPRVGCVSENWTANNMTGSTLFVGAPTGTFDLLSSLLTGTVPNENRCFPSP